MKKPMKLWVWLPSCRSCVPRVRCGATSGRKGGRFSSYRSHDKGFETAKVVCGSSGSIDVDIYNGSALSSPSAPLIIYLPPTGAHLRSAHPPIPTYLFHPSSALASINYRWNIPCSSPTNSHPTPTSTSKLLSSHPSFNHHPFPTPLHDTLHAYNYLLSSLLQKYNPTPSSPTPASWTSTGQTLYTPCLPHKKEIQRPLLLYGTHLGGSLATSLALTESFSSKNLPTRITGLISKNGIYSWVEIACSPSPPPKTPAIEKGWDSRDLYHLRDHLFTTPTSTFDPFASPLLFFRTTGLPPPQSWPSSSSSPPSTPKPVDRIAEEDEDTFYPTADPSLITDIDIDLEIASSHIAEGEKKGRYAGEIEAQVERKAHLKFPPKDSGLRVPRSLFLYTCPPSSSASNNTPNQNPQREREIEDKVKPKSKPKSQTQQFWEEHDGRGLETTPRGQAEEMCKLMRRSVMLHEFKDRRLWDEDLDPGAEAGGRVRVIGVCGEREDGVVREGEEGQTEEEVVRRWIEETLDL